MRQPDPGPRGWDDYAPFYDWENARSLGRRDVPFWRTVALQVGGPVLELGCGTGRLSIPLARAGVPLVGIDRSEPMLGARAARQTSACSAAVWCAGDIRFLPFADAFTAGVAVRGPGAVRMAVAARGPAE